MVYYPFDAHSDTTFLDAISTRGSWGALTDADL
jgi:hypothetical protein